MTPLPRCPDYPGLGKPSVKKCHALKKLDAFPSRLDELYERILDQILNLEVEDEDVWLRKQVLGIVMIAYLSP